MARVYVLQHAAAETPGLIGTILSERGIPTTTVRGFEGEPIPASMKEHDALVVMGGPMGVYEQDRYPFLKDEVSLIRDALAAGKPVLGICLGSELLAAALGARVTPARKEIGWFPLTLSPAAADDPLWRGVDPSFNAFHWHGDAFDLPSEAVSLARSALTPCQAFRHGRAAYGFLFHMEMDELMVRAMVDNFGDELREAGGDARAVLAEAGALVREMSRIGRIVFDRWSDQIGSNVGRVNGATR